MELWSHQKEAIERASTLNSFGLFFEPGCGKSLTAIKILEQKFELHSRVLKTLILCPVIVVEQWAREWKKYSTVHHGYVQPLLGTQKNRTKNLLQQLTRHSGTIAITNYEGLYLKDFLSLIKAWGPEAIVIDESHRIKTPDSKRTKTVIELSKKARYRLLLSGTPVLNNLMDIWAQMFVLDQGKALGEKAWTFRQNYFIDLNERRKGTVGYFPNLVPRPQSAEIISKLIAPLTMHVKKSEALDLPPLVRKDIFVELSTAQRAAYEQMKKDFVTFLDDKECSADLAITKALRLQQMVSGFISFDDKTTKDFKENPRLEVLEELLSDVAPYHKVIVWCVWKRNYEQVSDICKKLKLGYTELHGEIRDKDSAVQDFSNNPDCRVLIGHPGSGGIGVNLVAASHSIFYTRNFSLEQEIQAQARNYRGGSKEAGHETITRIDIIAKGTIDELILSALKRKAELGERVLSESTLSNAEILDILKTNLKNI